MARDKIVDIDRCDRVQDKERRAMERQIKARRQEQEDRRREIMRRRREERQILSSVLDSK